MYYHEIIIRYYYVVFVVFVVFVVLCFIMQCYVVLCCFMFRIRSIGEKIAGAGRSTVLPRSGRAARAGLGGSPTRGSDFGGCGRDNALAGEDVDVGAVFE